ncbi:Sterol uptake control protein 2-like protein 1 [Colletotrichum chlorophyti]|uniref:Sterol uptake control protein 2-like protein 1 n=1 Tax=Colletotrichum chlorophyti TaxID=708187 RepID=A0A1Q8RV40_9PEZI|nr:Sterol uptake control protein 2-like protein 1 [Colletotrichum chlorophyti]
MSSDHPMPSPSEAPEQQPLKRRRPHKKSKTGCLDCRKRRVKCGEERPSCRSCVRREIFCDYPGEAHSANNQTSPAPEFLDQTLPARPSPASQLTRESSRVAPCPPTTPELTPGAALNATPASVVESPAFGIRDLALLHHWTVSTSVDIYKTPGPDALWQVIFPQIGFEYPFVAHAILSLAALHMAYIDGSYNSSYVTEATQHHETALAGFHDVVRNFTSEKSEALLAWSVLNILYVFSISKQLAAGVERDSPRARKDRVLGIEWIPMMRGVDAIVAPHYGALRDGRISPMLDLGNWNELDLDHAVSDLVDIELCRTRSAWGNSNDAETYEQALQILRRCRMYMLQFDSMDTRTLERWGYNRAWAAPLAVIHFAPQQYFTLLHQRQPPALVLFSYLGAFLHTLDDHWFLEGWGRDIVEVIDELLGSYWRPSIQWPLRVVGLA